MLGVLVALPLAGVAGAIDMQEQSYLDAAKVTVPARRLDQMYIGPTGLPFAPDGLTDCQEAQFYRIQVGLPSVFDRLAFAESNCRNDVNSFCCYGIWQLYVSLHLRDHRLSDRYHTCGIYSIDDVFGDNPRDKQRNACGAKAVYDVMGATAWDTY